MTGEINDYGVHSFKSLGLALEYAHGPIDTMVVGTIAIWGEVIEHERGYRAENACVASLIGIGKSYNASIIGTNRPYEQHSELIQMLPLEVRSRGWMSMKRSKP